MSRVKACYPTLEAASAITSATRSLRLSLPIIVLGMVSRIDDLIDPLVPADLRD